MGNNEYKLGFTSCYINDHNFNHKTDIPVEAAVAWAASMSGDSSMGNGVLAKDLTTDGDNETDTSENGWLNKLFIIVGYEHGKFIAICKQDEKFSIRIEN